MGNLFSWPRWFLSLPNDHPTKIIGMAFAVAVTASFLVSYAAVTLKPLIDANRESAAKVGMLEIVELLDVEVPEARFIKLSSGNYVEKASDIWRQIPLDRDPAHIGLLEEVATVYEIRDGGTLSLVILPIRGMGYNSTLRGFLVLERDINTVAAVKFNEHDETPGIGAKIDSDAWTRLWAGKKISDGSGRVLLEVVKGQAKGYHEVDGISGATRTGDGITRLMRFWLGPDGYGPYLDRLRQGDTWTDQK